MYPPTPPRGRRRGRRLDTTAAIIAVGVTLVAASCTSEKGTSSRSTSTDGVLEVPRSESDLKITAGPGTKSTVTVAIKVPADATEMQLGTDATFTTDEWVPVRASADVALPNVGYQTIFARFRTASKEVSAPSVVGVTSDPTLEAATSSPRVPASVGMAGPKILQVTIENGRVVSGGLDDEDRLVGFIDGLDELADQAWTLQSDTDPTYESATTTTAVYRVTRPNGSGVTKGKNLFAVVDDYFLVLPGPLTAGSTYEITAPREQLAPISFKFDPSSSPSPSVHVNQVGFDPLDPVKLAHVSGWMGDGGGIEFPSAPQFSVIDEKGTEVLRAAGTRRTIPSGGELGRGDLTGSEVWVLDFSVEATPGTYRVCVDSLGCSVSFTIAPKTWQSVAVGVARAMYHQRSGTELTAPYTSVERPAAHAEGGKVPVHASSYTLLEATKAEGDDGFKRLEAGATKTVVKGAWGGHFDAGDWDRRIQHLFYVRSAIDLVTTYPELYATLDLAIPESGDAVPDILDEALWSLDLFSRLQSKDGGVSGGIESTGHPAEGSTSWTDKLPLFAYAPDPWSTYIYAATAAEMSIALAPYDAESAADLVSRAERAMEWADSAKVDPRFADDVTVQRATAEAAMFRLTGDAAWQTAFASHSALGDGPFENLGCHGNDICDAAWIFARTDNRAVDPKLKENVLASFRSTGDNLLASAATTAFGWTPEHPENPLIWGLGVGGAPKTIGLLRAYQVTKDERYLRLAYSSTSVSLGDNPTNTSYVTGFGAHPVREPLVVDSIEAGVPIWPGTPVYGAHQIGDDQRWIEDSFLQPAGVTPGGFDVPYLWSHFDIHSLPPMNEFTVFQSHGPALFAFGALAAESADAGQ